MESETILNINDLSVSFGDLHILKNLNFFVKKGDVLAIVGPNGAGKSVLFRAIMGLIPFTGKVEWQPGTKINYIPQKFFIDYDMPLSVEEFFKFKTKDMDTIISTLEAVGFPGEQHANENEHKRHHYLHHLLKKRIGWLSGGQLQRLLIAWSILDNPDVLLFDEPTSGIDVGGEETIYNLLTQLKEERNMTILLISHDLNVVYKYANVVICVNKEMVCYGTPNVVLDPSSLAKLYGDDVSFYKHEHKHEHQHESLNNNG